MSDTIKSSRIAELNDLCRKTMGGLDDQVYLTAGIFALHLADQSAIRETVEQFDNFTSDNNPYGERDFGSFDHAGTRIFWKIDYYDRASFGTGRDMGSEDPSNAVQTMRVLTIMLASEY